MVFPTRLGWMAMITCGPVVLRLNIGFQSRQSALEALDRRLLAGAECILFGAQSVQSALPAEAGQSAAVAQSEQYAFSAGAEQSAWPAETETGQVCSAGWLMERLQAYAAGQPVDFLDVAVALGPLSDFRRRIVGRCRRIPYGRTATYGQLARLAGSPGAARAVGQALAANRVPIIVPCHRIVGANGSLGGFSAPGGVELKRRLLELEAGALNNLRARKREPPASVGKV